MIFEGHEVINIELHYCLVLSNAIQDNNSANNLF